MPKPFKYTSMDRVFSKIERDFGLTTFNEYDIVEWIGEALEQIGAITQYQESVQFIKVKNHQCEIPTGLVNIIQIARKHQHSDDCTPDEVRTCCSIPVSTGLLPVKVDSCGHPISDTAGCPVLIDCHGSPITDFEVAYYRPFFDLQGEYFGWRNSDLYRSKFTPIRLATHTLFNSLVCQINNDNDYDDAYRHSQDEYQVIDGQILRFSFQHGQIAIAYKKIFLDPETGYPMIPDLVSVTTALGYYIQWKMSSRDFYKNREGANNKMIEAEKQWVWYCRQAGNELIQPYGVDDYQNLLDQLTYLVPQKQRYFGFFGRLSKPEDTLQYDNPNGRMLNLFRQGSMMG